MTWILTASLHHFSLCPPDTCLPPKKQTTESPTRQSTYLNTLSMPFRFILQLVGDNDPPDVPKPYLHCSHQPPARYSY